MSVYSYLIKYAFSEEQKVFVCHFSIEPPVNAIKTKYGAVLVYDAKKYLTDVSSIGDLEPNELFYAVKEYGFAFKDIEFAPLYKLKESRNNILVAVPETTEYFKL